MNLLAKLIARVLFAMRGPWSTIRANAGIVALLLVVSHWALRPGGVASVLGTFIEAGVTTSSSWNVGGPSGPVWTTDGSGNSTISASASMTVDSPNQANLGNQASTVNVGTSFPAESTINIGDQSDIASNTINIGSATGAPTINIQTAQEAPVGQGLFIATADFNLNQPGPPAGAQDGITFGAVNW